MALGLTLARLSRLRPTIYQQPQRKLPVCTARMKVAVAGCCHGDLDETYKQINDLETQNQYKIDLLLINGDFQAIRNHQDMLCMASPKWHMKLGLFYKYYTGEVAAPVLTIVIGGNHEASNYMWELYHGGWLAPNIYYLGGSGCVKVNGVRIAGSSGIYKSNNYRLGHHEQMPYNNSSLRSIYHTRLYDVMKLRQLSTPDVFMSHDWPVDITKYGNLPQLLELFPRFKPSVEAGELGSPPMMDLLWSLRPTYWFSAHMHCKFEAIVPHEPETGESSVTALDQGSAAPSKVESGSAGGAANVHPPLAANPSQPVSGKYEQPPSKSSSTHFLALDKCSPKREYLHVLDITPSTPPTGPVTDPPTLTFDREWLAISRALHPYLSTTRRQPDLPPAREMAPLIQESQQWVDEHVGEREIRQVQEFVMTAPGPVNTDPKMPRDLQPPPCYTNPQTESFCAMLGLESKVNPPR